MIIHVSTEGLERTKTRAVLLSESMKGHFGFHTPGSVGTLQVHAGWNQDTWPKSAQQVQEMQLVGTASQKCELSSLEIHWANDQRKDLPSSLV